MKFMVVALFVPCMPTVEAQEPEGSRAKIVRWIHILARGHVAEG